MARNLWHRWEVTFNVNHRKNRSAATKYEKKGGKYPYPVPPSKVTIGVLANGAQNAKKFAREIMAVKYPRKLGYSWNVDSIKEK